jgi:predicted permease
MSRRVRALFSKADLDRELDEEMRLHLALETEDLVRSGIDREEAARRARVAFGGVERHKEATRDSRGVSAIEDRLRDLGYILRSLRRTPVFTLAVVLSLALGIGANSTMFTIINAVLLRPLPYPHAEELLGISSMNRGAVQDVVLEPYFRAWLQASRTLSSLAMYAPTMATIAGEALPERVPGAGASAELFDVLGVHPARGRSFTHDDETTGALPVVIISDALWRRHFAADSGIVGRLITINDLPKTVIGLMPPGFDFPQRASFWTPWKTPTFSGKAVGFFFAGVVARPRPGVPLITVQRELSQLMRVVDRQLPPPARGSKPLVMSLHDQLFGSAKPALTILFASVLLLLLIACANVANLVLARTANRGRELAVRVTLGATRGTLAWLILAESALLATAGAALGLVASIWATRLFIVLSPPTISTVGDVGANGPVFAFTAGLAMCTALLVGAGPAMRAARRDPGSSLGEGGTRQGAGRVASRLRRALVVCQLATAVVLLAGAGLLIESLARLSRVNLGFQPDHVLVVNLSLSRAQYPDGRRARAFFDQLIHRLRGAPGVRDVAYGAPPLMGMVSSKLFPPESAHPGVTLSETDVGSHFFETFGVPVREGRGILASDDSGSVSVAVINESAARLFFPGGGAVGRPFDDGVPGSPHPMIVGVVADYPQQDVAVRATPELFSASAQSDGYPGEISVRTSGDPEALIPLVRIAVHELDPALAVGKITTMDKVVASSMAPIRFASLLLGAFAGLALVLAALGLYGVIAYGVAQRLHELGIRAALGATGRRLMWLVAGEMSWVIALSLAIGLPGAWLLTRVMQSLLYDTGVHDPLIFVLVPLALVATAAIATLIPARRALHVNPLDVIRSD